MMFDQYLQAMLLRQRGNNQQLAQEILSKLSPDSKQRLFRLLQDMEQTADTERAKRKRGQFW